MLALMMFWSRWLALKFLVGGPIIAVEGRQDWSAAWEFGRDSPFWTDQSDDDDAEDEAAAGLVCQRLRRRADVGCF